MSSDEAVEFESHPYFDDIIKVRQWDEKAKIENMKTNTLEYYQTICIDFLKAI